VIWKRLRISLQRHSGEYLVCIFFLVAHHNLVQLFWEAHTDREGQREFSDSPAEPSNPETKARRQSQGAMYSLCQDNNELDLHQLYLTSFHLLSVLGQVRTIKVREFLAPSFKEPRGLLQSQGEHQIKEKHQLGVVVHSCNPSTQEQRQENHEFKTSLGYTVSSRPVWNT
jgi:hypothetical protein